MTEWPGCVLCEKVGFSEKDGCEVKRRNGPLVGRFMQTKIDRDSQESRTKTAQEYQILQDEIGKWDQNIESWRFG
jgi:hypothetical protein